MKLQSIDHKIRNPIRFHPNRERFRCSLRHIISSHYNRVNNTRTLRSSRSIFTFLFLPFKCTQRCHFYPSSTSITPTSTIRTYARVNLLLSLFIIPVRPQNRPFLKLIPTCITPKRISPSREEASARRKRAHSPHI